MISCLATFECDTCGRKTAVEVARSFGPIDLLGIMHSIGWREYLNGPTLCPECSDNTFHAERVASAIDSVGLSIQERRVVDEVAKGKTNREIAEALGVRIKTARNYLSFAMRKLKMRRREDVAVAVKLNEIMNSPGNAVNGETDKKL